MPIKYTQAQVEEDFLKHGSKLLTPYVNLQTPIKFLCSNCGKVQVSSWRSCLLTPYEYRYWCTSCKKDALSQRRRKPFLDISIAFEKKGAHLLSKPSDYKNKNTLLNFTCSKCGNIWRISWANYKRGKNPNLLCPKCSKREVPTTEFVASVFKSKGAELINTYVNHQALLYFKCARCGDEWHISWSRYTAGQNPNLLCPKCNKVESPSINYIRDLFAAKGAELISEEYTNNKTPLYFRCSKCKNKVHYISWSDYKSGYNKDLLCAPCYLGEMYNPRGQNCKQRLLVDSQWLSWSLELYNVDSSIYAAHHLKQFAKYPDLRTSLCNFYPLKKEFHAQDFEWKGEQNPFHRLSELVNPENFPDFVKLPYHTYRDFHFLDLNSVVVTEIIFPFVEEEKYVGRTNAEDINGLLLKKQYWASNNLLYLPFYFSEMVLKRSILFSMLRARLWKYFPDIYQYTGEPFYKYYARKLIIKEVEGSEVKDFQDATHIQGFVGASHYVTLQTEEGEIVSCMSFGKPRSKAQDIQEYELIRYSTKLNSMVVGGAQRLFKYFVSTYAPSSIVSFCDIRFSSLNPDETVYPRLGFKYISTSKPNYKYIREDTLTMYSRQMFQKHKLKDKLEIFDEQKSEFQNMRENGYIRQYDCGNFKFVWTREEN